ncbi:MAG: hypothetical protein P4M08_11310 [Oligoflexia bacterium]|nr:hypothetical protein [Oligoflexia bacterium]
MIRTKDQLDPLFTIFEQHLYNFQDSEIDRKTFVGDVVKDYLNYLRKLGISIPTPLEHAIAEELSLQVKSMLVKKIYGCLSIQDYRENQPVKESRKVRGATRNRYSKLQKAAEKTERQARSKQKIGASNG